jgi:hypothetical protein
MNDFKYLNFTLIHNASGCLAKTSRVKPPGSTMRKKNMGFDHIGPVMQAVMTEFYKKADQGLLKVHAAWVDSVDAAVLQNAKPAAIKGKMLIVHVTNSIWLQELFYMKNDLIQKMNQKLASQMVEEIKFKIGPV